MRLLFSLVVISLCVSGLWARQIPLTGKEISLMLRSGYSSEAVLRELDARRFAGPLDEVLEKNLTQSGATPALLGALKSGKYAAAPADAARANEELAIQAQRRAVQAEESRKLNALYQNQLANDRASASSQPAVANTIYPLLKGDLVQWRNGSLTRFDDQSLEKKKLYALYFSAGWCGPCRKFTPQLVDFYNRVAPQHPEFELIFMSKDRSQFSMETYMRDMNMPWPAIDFAKVGGKAVLKNYGGSGIPCLVVLDGSGKVLSHSYEGQNYLGPAKVMADLDAIFARGGPLARVIR